MVESQKSKCRASNIVLGTRINLSSPERVSSKHLDLSMVRSKDMNFMTVSKLAQPLRPQSTFQLHLRMGIEFKPREFSPGLSIFVTDFSVFVSLKKIKTKNFRTGSGCVLLSG